MILMTIDNFNFTVITIIISKYGSNLTFKVLNICEYFYAYKFIAKACSYI